MDFALLIRHRLKELGLEQRDLATAARVTESYISQLLARKKAPPAPNRTDVYDKMERFLGLAGGELAMLGELQRKEFLRKRVEEPPRPLFKDFRELILRKCRPGRGGLMRGIFEKDAFGELERLVTQKLLDVAKDIAKVEMGNESWLRMVARRSRLSPEQMRAMLLEFLDTDVFHVSADNCVSLMDPLIESWDMDLQTFGLEIVLNPDITLTSLRRFDFMERPPDRPSFIEPGFEEFLKDSRLCGGATSEDLEFLGQLRFGDKRPTALYFYRELQNLQDPLHFRHPKR